MREPGPRKNSVREYCRLHEYERTQPAGEVGPWRLHEYERTQPAGEVGPWRSRPAGEVGPGSKLEIYPYLFNNHYGFQQP